MNTSTIWYQYHSKSPQMQPSYANIATWCPKIFQITLQYDPKTTTCLHCSFQFAMVVNRNNRSCMPTCVATAMYMWISASGLVAMLLHAFSRHMSICATRNLIWWVHSLSLTHSVKHFTCATIEPHLPHIYRLTRVWTHNVVEPMPQQQSFYAYNQIQKSWKT